MQSIPVSIACSLMLSGLNERQSTVSTDVATVLPSRLFDYMIKEQHFMSQSAVPFVKIKMHYSACFIIIQLNSSHKFQYTDKGTTTVLIVTHQLDPVLNCCPYINKHAITTTLEFISCNNILYRLQSAILCRLPSSATQYCSLLA